MATLYFKVSSDYEEVIRLRQECEKLEAQLLKMDKHKSPGAVASMETQLASTRQQMMGLVTEAAKAGAVMENDLKNKISSTTKASDELSEEIIKQKKIIRETQEDVRRLSEQYSKMNKYSPKYGETVNELNRAKAALNEQRYSLGELQEQQAKNRLELRKLNREYKDFAQSSDKSTEIVDNLIGSLKRTAAEIGGFVAIKQFSSDVIEATGKMQQLQVALSTILQSKSKADALLADISQFAVKTPFSVDEVATGAKQLLAYGSSADKVVDELSMLGDVASGLQIPIGQLIYLYGTLRTQGRAMTVDIKQFAGRGIPIYEELAKVLGVAKDEVSGLVTEGKVGFAEVEQAFKNMTTEGGKFNNMLANSAGTWPQQIAAVQGTLFLKMNDFGNKYKEVFELGIGTAEDLVENLEDVISIIGSLVAAYGTYKAAVIAVAVAQKASGFVESIRLISMFRKEMTLATAAQQAFNVASKANIYVTLLSVLAGLATAVYMYTRRTNELTVAQETLNSVNKKAGEEFSKQAATVDRLSSVLKSETSSLEQKKKALSDLQTIIPGYNANLNEEGRLINSNTEAIKVYLAQLEKQIRIKAAQEELEELYRKKRTQEKQQKEAADNYNKAKLLYKSSVTMTSSNLQNSGINTGVTVFSQNSAVNNQLKDSASKAKKELESVNKELGETVSAISTLEKEINQSSISDKKEAPQSIISKELDDVTNKIKNLKQEISDLRNGKIQVESGKTVESVIESKIKELQQAEKSLETLTGVKHSTRNSPKTKDLFITVPDEEVTLITPEEIEKNIAMHREAMDRYLSEYGDYQQKRLAIADMYALKISQAETEGEKLSLQKQSEEALKALDFEEFKKSINFADVFGDLDTQTTESLRALRDKLGDYINEAAKDLRPEDLKELQDAFKNLDFKIADRSPFNELKSGLAEYKSAQDAVIKAQEDLNSVMNGGVVTISEYDKETGQLVTRTIDQAEAEKNLNKALSARQGTLAKLTKAANVLQDEKFVSVLTTVNSDFIEYIQNIEKYGEQLEEIAEKEMEVFTGISFDSFKDGFVDMLSDLDATNEDFADNFEGYLQKAIFSSLVAGQYKDRIKKLYDQWANYGESGNQLTADEAQNLRNEYQDIVNDMLEQREQIMKDFGWSSSSSSGQSASSRGFGSEMTHEDAGELSGRFTALQMTGEEIKIQNQQQTVAITELRGSISALAAQTQSMHDIADETRTILVNSYMELQEIRENTGESAKYLKDIKADIAVVKQNTARL